MKTATRFLPSLIASAVLAVSAGQALAADPVQAKTRDQVKAELNEAIRTGNIVAGGESGLKLNELFPGSYANADKAGQGKTRADVKAELRDAIATGDVVAGGDSGMTLKQLSPNSYAEASTRQQAVDVAQGKTRAQVKAELADALRTGAMVAGGDSGQKLNELFPGHYTGDTSPVLASQPERADRSGS